MDLKTISGVNQVALLDTKKVGVLGNTGDYKQIRVGEVNSNNYIPETTDDGDKGSLNPQELAILDAILKLYSMLSAQPCISKEDDNNSVSGVSSTSAAEKIKQYKKILGSGVADIAALLADFLEQIKDTNDVEALMTCLHNIAEKQLTLSAQIQALRAAIEEAKAKLKDGGLGHNSASKVLNFLVFGIVGVVISKLTGVENPLDLLSSKKAQVTGKELASQMNPLDKLLQDVEDLLKALSELVDLIMKFLNSILHPDGIIIPDSEHPDGAVVPSENHPNGTIPPK